MFDAEREDREFIYDSPYQHAVHQVLVDAADGGDTTSEWLLTCFDTWVRNPFFTGVPSGDHPESYRD